MVAAACDTTNQEWERLFVLVVYWRMLFEEWEGEKVPESVVLNTRYRLS